jgi:hypothetical protein
MASGVHDMGLAHGDDYFREFFAVDDTSLCFKAPTDADEIEYAEYEIITEETAPLLEYRGVSTAVEYEWPIRRACMHNHAAQQHH